MARIRAIKGYDGHQNPFFFKTGGIIYREGEKSTITRIAHDEVNGWIYLYEEDNLLTKINDRRIDYIYYGD